MGGSGWSGFGLSGSRIGVVPGASIYPFVWNILRAARNEGLGGARRRGCFLSLQ